MVLKFLENSFVLEGATERPEGFYRAPSGACYTKNIKCAAQFRQHADSKAEMVFNKLMLRSFALPRGRVLFPKDEKPYPFQFKGVEHILTTSKTYLADDPGLGKTAQAIMSVSTKPGRTLIVCPSFLKVTWARQITRWFFRDFPSIEIVPESAKKEECDWFADFIIVSDAMLIKDWVVKGLAAQKFRHIRIDEGHRFKTHDSSRAVALFGGQTPKIKSPGLIYNSEHVVMMSGTPILNRPIELWPVLYAMAPELIDFMPRLDFGFRYGGAVQNDRGQWTFPGSAREEELRERIMGRFMLRRMKKDVLKDLPPKVREVIYVDQDTRTPDIKRMDLELLRALRKTMKDSVPDSTGEYALVRHMTGLSKIGWSAGYVHNILADSNESILLFAHHRDVVEGLCKLLAPWAPMVIYGGVDEERRTKIQDLFQVGRRRLIIGNIAAMNLGLTLTRGSRCIFAEYDWTGPNNEQAEDRLHRIGQKDSVFCQYLVLPGSIDEFILGRVMEKDLSIKKVTG